MGNKQLSIITINGSCWPAVQKLVQSDEVQDTAVICAQEVELRGDKLAQAIQWCEVRGWHAVISECDVGENSYNSSGACILTRPELNIGVQPAALPVYIPQSRAAAAAILELPGHKPVVSLSMYFEASEGLNNTNLYLLATAGRCQQKCRTP
eukprot:4974781-Pyramimonas_sp.AAC.1